MLFRFWGVSSHLRIFTHLETSPKVQVKGCKFAIWPLSSEGSLACHTYCDTRHLFIMVISDRHGININNLIHFFSSFSSCPTFPSIPSYCKLKREPGECCEKPVCEFSQQHGSFTGTGSTSGKGVGKLW